MTIDIAKLIEMVSKLPALDDNSEWLASNPARLVLRVDHAIVEIAEFSENLNSAYAAGRRPLDCAIAVAAMLNAAGPGGGGLLERYALLDKKLELAKAVVRSLLDLADEMIGYVPQSVEKWDLSVHGPVIRCRLVHRNDVPARWDRGTELTGD